MKLLALVMLWFLLILLLVPVFMELSGRFLWPLAELYMQYISAVHRAVP